MRRKKISILLLLFYLFSLFVTFIPSIVVVDTVEAVFLDPYYLCDFDDQVEGTINVSCEEPVNGTEWLTVTSYDCPHAWPPLNLGVYDSYKRYRILKMNVGQSRYTEANFSLSLDAIFVNYTVIMATSSDRWRVYNYFNNSDNETMFYLKWEDINSGESDLDCYLYDKDDNLLDSDTNLPLGYTPFTVNVTLNTTEEDMHIEIGNSDIDYWLDCSNFGFIRNINFDPHHIFGSLRWFSVDNFYILPTPANTPPVMDSFYVDTEPGANSGWDLDNNDVQIDFDFHDIDGDTVDLYFTFNKGSQARQPTTGDYDARILTASNQSNFDLDWTGGSWSDYDGAVYVRCRAWDGENYSDDATPVLNVDYDYLDFGIDGTAPTTSANAPATWRITSATTTIEATASDSPSNDNIDYVNLYYRSSDDNVSFGSWNDYGADTTPSPWGWTFNFPDGTGFYEFYTVGTDEAGNVESAPGSADTRCLKNYAPIMGNEYPDNESQIGDVEPECWVRVVDADYDLLDVYFYENTTGSWVLRESYIDVASNSYQSFDYEQADHSGTYYWKVVLTDGHETLTNIYWFNISGGGCPYISGVIPANGSYVYNLYPNCQFDANDDDSETVDYEIWENTTGSWVRRQYGTVEDGDTVYWTFTQADGFNETYYWRVNLSDGDCYRIYTYHFKLVINPPYNLQVTDQDEESLDVSWFKGPGTTHTLVLYKEAPDWPDNPYDGTAYTAYFGTGTSTHIGGLPNATTFYIRAWSYLSGDYSELYDQTSGTTEEGDTPPGPSEPGGFVCRNINEATRLLLQWNLGEDNWVHIRSATDDYPLTIYDGTFVYNGSGAVFYDSDLTPGELYYYSAFFESYADNTSRNITDPNPPTNLDLDVYSGSNFSVSWTLPDEGFYNTTVIRAKNNTAPSNENDGELFYNGSGSSCYAETNYYPYAFGAWSYVEEDGFYAYSERADMDDVEGNVVMNCYNEYTGNNITLWNIIITSNTGGTEHTAYNRNNTYVVDTGPWSTADYYTFKFTKTDYYSGWYSYTEDEIDTVVNFPIDCYMASIGGGNGSQGGDDWYELLVLNEFDIVVEGVRVALYHVTNETTGNKTLVSLWYTDNYGEVQFEGIIAGDEYYVNLSKSGYITCEYRWIPGADDHYKTFKIYSILPPGEDAYNPWDYITFTAVFSDNTTLVVTYLDTSGLTLDGYFKVYENNSASFFQTSHFYDSDEIWTVPYNGTAPNRYRADYRIKLYIANHSYFGNWTATIFTSKLYTSYIETLIVFDTNVNAILGVPISGHAIGWVSIVFFCIGIFFLVSFGRFWAGVGIVVLGLFVAFFATLFGVPGLGVDQLLVFAAYCIIYGALYEFAKQKRGRIV